MENILFILYYSEAQSFVNHAYLFKYLYLLKKKIYIYEVKIQCFPVKNVLVQMKNSELILK